MSETIIQRQYKPTAKAQIFHGSDAFVQVVVGGLGGGKTRMAIQEVEQSALQWPGMPMAIYRKTLPSLRDSTMQEWKNHSTPELWHWGERDTKASCLNGSFVAFRGLDEASKVKSTEYALILLEEADEFTFEDFMYLKARVRKKGPWPLRIVLILNPVDESHWIYKEFGGGPNCNNASYESSGGLLVLHLSTYDNADNLPVGYIEQVTAGMSPDEIERYIFGKWGTIVRGEPVYKKYLNPDIHIEKWDYQQGAFRLERGWDFGFNHPACSFRLVNYQGRKNCNWAMIGDKIDLDVFAHQVLETTERMYPGAYAKDFGDPRGHDKTHSATSTGPSTAFEVLKELGIHAVGERNSREYVEDGIKQVRKEFATLIGGKPQLTIDPRNTIIRTAYFGKYVRGEDGSPVKDEYYHHACDGDRYISHHSRTDGAVEEAIKRNKQMRQERPVRNRITGYR